jgi:hypothetical protein
MCSLRGQSRIPYEEACDRYGLTTALVSDGELHETHCGTSSSVTFANADARVTCSLDLEALR